MQFVKIRDLISLFVFSGDVHSYQGFEDKKKSILLNLFLYLYLLSVAGGMAYDVFNGGAYLFANLIGLLVGFLLFYLYRVRKMLKLVSGTFVFLIIAFVSLLIQKGGIPQMGIVFSLLLPIPAILLLGRRNGMISICLFLFLNVFCYVFLRNESWYPRYDLFALIRTGIVFVLITVMAYANEFVFGILFQRSEKLSEYLRVSQQSYKNMAENKEKFVSLVLHDLGDHVGGVAASAASLNDEYQNLSESKRIKKIGSLASSSLHNYKLLHDLMKWATVQNEVIPFSPGPIRLEKIYSEIIEFFNPLIEEKQLSFFLKLKSNMAVFADENMVSSIMRSLVSNAIKFSYPGGEVRISAWEDGDKMAVSISDNGCGMSEEDLMRIDASVSFSTEGTLHESGTGIGLILVKEFLQKNGGDLHIESVKEKGTEVMFTLPLET